MHPYEVLRRPVITEKSTLLQEQNKYVFEVSREANKTQVKEAVKKAFGVEVASVNMITMHGKPKRFGPRFVKTKDWKKAIVSLEPGQKIEMFEGA